MNESFLNVVGRYYGMAKHFDGRPRLAMLIELAHYHLLAWVYLAKHRSETSTMEVMDRFFFTVELKETIRTLTTSFFKNSF